MNRSAIIIELLAAGLDGKEAVKIAEQQLKDRGAFYKKLTTAQTRMKSVVNDLMNNFTNKKYANVDQFLEKGRSALNDAGLTLFTTDSKEIVKMVTDKNGIDQPEKHWEIALRIGDSQSGYKEEIFYAIPVGREQDVGKSDSYALKYLTRSLMMSPREEDDPDKRHDIDAQDYQSNQRKKKSTAKKRTKAAPAPKNPLPAKPVNGAGADKPVAPKKTPRTNGKTTKKGMNERVERARARLAACKEELKEGPMKAILNDAGFTAQHFNEVQHFEDAADLLEARIIFDRLTIKLSDKIGQPETDKLLKDFSDINNVETLKAGIGHLSDSLNQAMEAQQ